MPIPEDATAEERRAYELHRQAIIDGFDEVEKRKEAMRRAQEETDKAAAEEKRKKDEEEAAAKKKKAQSWF